MRFFIISVLLLCAVAIPVHATTITVTNTNDSGPGSLRQALADANDGDTINFAVTGTVGLTNGELLVDKSITISGPGATNLDVNSNASRVFHIGSGKNASISGLMITGTNVFLNGGAILNDHATLTLSNCAVGGFATQGGGIYNDGGNGNAALTIVNSTVSGVSGDGAGGGIVNEAAEGSATLTIVNSAVKDSFSTGASPPEDFGVAGGIYNQLGIVTITNSTISGNSASNEGGGIVNGGGTLTITNSAVSGNQAGGFGTNNYAGIGGGISNQGTLTISNSTISGNTAFGNDLKGPGFGGGIYNVATLVLTNSTLSGNSAINGGAMYNSGTVEIGNTVLKAGMPGGNIVNSGGTVTSQGYNISTDDGGGNLTGPGDQINTDPMIGPLGDNGGPTLTHALLPGSPAINAGDPKFIPPPLYDQRGCPFVRVFNDRIDIGSLETQPPRRPCPTPRPRPTPAPRPASI